MQRGAGELSHFNDASYEAVGATIADAPTRRRQPAREPADAPGGRVAPRGFDAPLVPLPAARPRHRARAQRPSRDRPLLRPAAADLARPVHGRALLAGDGVGLPRRLEGRVELRPLLPAPHDGRGHDSTGQGPGHGCRRRRAPGHLHGEATRRQGARLRRALGGQGGGRIGRRGLRETRRDGRRGRRLRARADRRGTTGNSRPRCSAKSPTPTSSSRRRRCRGASRRSS